MRRWASADGLIMFGPFVGPVIFGPADGPTLFGALLTGPAVAVSGDAVDPGPP